MQITQAIAAAILAFSYGASAHITMSKPTPFGTPAKDPLLADGSNFPCQAPDYTATSTTTWEAGSTQTVELLGTAVHGGGSCQFSFTTDQKPTKDSVWKVIHSVIGGCPKAGVTGNLPDVEPGAAGYEGPDPFPITIPKDTPNGQLTFAWTWFNKVGNREMYMNCAPVTITGGADVSATALEALPDMFVANVAEAACTSVPDQNLAFPKPGTSLLKLGLAADLGVPGYTGTGCQAAGTGSTPTSPSAAPGDGQQAAPSSVASYAPVVAPASSAAPVVAPASSSTAAAVPVASAAPSSAPAVAPVSGGTPCTTNGALVCISATQFGICDNGNAVAMAVAEGTTCSNGAIVRRAVRHPHSRRHSSSMLRRQGASFKA